MSYAAPVAVGDPQYPNPPFGYPPAPGTPGIGLADTILGGTFTPQHTLTPTLQQMSIDYNPPPSTEHKYTCLSHRAS